MDEFVRELKESAAGLHDGMGGHADHCAALMEKAASVIAEYQETFTAQALALKAAKAMQQAETERADANERDAARYRWLKHEYVKSNIFIVHRETSRDFIMCGSRADFVIDQAMSNV